MIINNKKTTIKHDGYSAREGRIGRIQDSYQPTFGAETRSYQANPDSNVQVPTTFPASASVTSLYNTGEASSGAASKSEES
jgi:hypothetical protein